VQYSGVNVYLCYVRGQGKALTSEIPLIYI
jgi:hypothetical protein